MFMDFVQTIIPRQQLIKKPRRRPTKRTPDVVWTAMADTQSDAGSMTPETNPPQLRAVSSLIQM
jgi:hypothetical protein